MKKICSILMLISLVVGFIGCNETAEKKESNFEPRSIEDMGFDTSMKSLVDSFIVELRQYSERGPNMVGLIKIMDSDSGNTFKVCLQGIESEKDLEKINIDNYFTHAGFHFGIDYNISGIIKPKKNFKKEDFIKYARVADYITADARMPGWLVQIKGGNIVKMNKYANSLFGIPTTEVGYSTKGGIKYYKVTEWGEIIDEEGNVIDIYNKKNW